MGASHTSDLGDLAKRLFENLLQRNTKYGANVVV